MEVQRNEFFISTARDRMDVDFIHDYLCNQSYWAQGRSRDVVEKSIWNSLCFGVFEGEQQVGFARVVTDTVTFAWLCDVFIAPSHQGRGLGKWLIESVVAHPDLGSVKNILLITRDAHELYRNYGGFEPISRVNDWLRRSGETVKPGNSAL
ncbi:MAG TPA: GNAT family N-acetyltransferase [Chloroflexi bacterium]|nr:GNAT family N-acetyltransferase [Chloroflexota bacterium]